MQTARIVRINWRSCPVRRIATRAVALHTSEQSRHRRMHWLMSMPAPIFISAMQASAQELQIAEQSMAWRTARPRLSL